MVPGKMVLKEAAISEVQPTSQSPLSCVPLQSLEQGWPRMNKSQAAPRLPPVSNLATAIL